MFNEITKSQNVDSLLAHPEDNEVYLKLLATVAMRENRFDDPLIVKGIEEEIERVRSEERRGGKGGSEPWKR